jgi:nitrogen regulatory protein PII
LMEQAAIHFGAAQVFVIAIDQVIRIRAKE